MERVYIERLTKKGRIWRACLPVLLICFLMVLSACQNTAADVDETERLQTLHDSEAETPLETRPLLESEPLQETESTQKSEPLQETESPQKSESLQESEPLQETESPQKSESPEEAEPLQKTESPEETEPPQETMPLPETEPLVETKYEIPASVWPESVPQFDPAITPEPGDTTATWDASRAENYPSDADCTDMELLEKWMAVEGLTFEDLEQRDCRQLVLVVAREEDGVQTYTVCYEKNADGDWVPAEGLSRMDGYTGSKGIAHERIALTRTSPAGLWALGCAFGNAEKPDGLKLPWRDVTPQSDWVCDEDTVYFNTWQERDDPDLLCTWDYDDDSIEHLEDYQSSYAYACVIRFNMPPYAVPERGSAIFFHCTKAPTLGCIGLYEPDMVATLLWLDPAKNPHILITGHENSH